MTRCKNPSLALVLQFYITREKKMFPFPIKHIAHGCNSKQSDQYLIFQHRKPRQSHPANSSRLRTIVNNMNLEYSCVWMALTQEGSWSQMCQCARMLLNCNILIGLQIFPRIRIMIGLPVRGNVFFRLYWIHHCTLLLISLNSFDFWCH